MKGSTPRRLRQYAAKYLGLKSYLRRPGDGRLQGRIPAADLLWALLMGVLLRRAAFAGIEAHVGADPLTLRLAVPPLSQGAREEKSFHPRLGGW
jgi:hypothetical protein